MVRNFVPKIPPALIVRYCTRRFIVDYSPEVSRIYSHQATLDSEEVAMDIWDTAGHFQLSLVRGENSRGQFLSFENIP